MRTCPVRWLEDRERYVRFQALQDAGSEPATAYFVTLVKRCNGRQMATGSGRKLARINEGPQHYEFSSDRSKPVTHAAHCLAMLQAAYSPCIGKANSSRHQLMCSRTCQRGTKRIQHGKIGQLLGPIGRQGSCDTQNHPCHHPAAILRKATHKSW